MANPINLNLSDMAEFWNRLYTTAIGRGINAPRCSPALAVRVISEYAAWRDFYTEAVAFEHLGWNAQATDFHARYGVLRDALAAEKISVDELPVSLIDHGVNVAVALADPATIKAALAGVAVLVFAPMIATAAFRIWGAATGRDR